MITRRPRAVTFDFWNTLFEPGRDTLRLRALRLAGWLEAPEEAVRTALVDAFELHNAEWRAGRCWGPRELAELLLRRFGPHAGAVDGRLEELTELVEVSGVSAGERVVDGAADVIQRLRRAGLRLGVVSDTGFSPGRVLRRFLDGAGLLQHFETAALTFSDEVGVPKPDPRIFRAAATGLGVQPVEIVHVGDLRGTDVAGAQAMGMGSVRFAGCHDDRGQGPEADAVIARLSDLPAALALD
ncbi:MAG TPA: HAD family hydrolase [Candidatus Dormibacteraeota bacterium]|nr:HAD family hydrolase [Candidatus Dormibacteraeota bacterium]